jgi:hypothetical protein
MTEEAAVFFEGRIDQEKGQSRRNSQTQENEGRCIVTFDKQ